MLNQEEEWAKKLKPEYSMQEQQVLGTNQEGVASDSFLGMANDAMPQQQPAQPSQEQQYISRLSNIEDTYKASQWDNPEQNGIQQRVQQPSTGDRVWNTLFNMGAAFLVSGGNPAAMALAGFKSYTDDEDMEYRYNMIPQLQKDGFSDYAIEAFHKTGDRRYLAEDSKARVAAEKEQYSRGIDVRNFEEDVRRSDRTFGLDERKQDETERSAREDEKIRYGNLAVSQQTANWQTNSRRLNSTITDDYGNKILLDELGREIAVYNGDGDLVGDGKGKKTTTKQGAIPGVEMNEIPLGYIMLDGSPMVHELSANGKNKLRAPTATELKDFQLSKDFSQDTGMSVSREKLDKYISDPQSIPDTAVGWTGYLTDKPITSDLQARVFGKKEDSEVNSYLNLMDGEGRIQGIQQAREAGAVGINTESEFKEFKKGFPALKRGNKEELARSLKLQRDYIDRFNENMYNSQKKWADVSITTGEDGSKKVEVDDRPRRSKTYRSEEQTTKQEESGIKVGTVIDMPDGVYDTPNGRVVVKGKRVQSVQ